MYLTPAETHRRRRRRWARLAIVLLLASGVAATLYAFFLEPRWIEVTHYSLSENVLRPLRIAHLTDLHAHEFGPREREVLRLIRAESPDMVVLTGDTADPGSLASARDFLVNLSAPLGVWIVRGSGEPWKLGEDERALYGALGAHFLRNQGASVREDVWVAGLDDPASGKPDLDRALAGAPSDAFKLVLLHAPDYFHEIAGRFDLALAGHSHGGQIWLPGFGPLWLPPGGRRYVRGWFTLNRSQLFVSRGLGTSVAPARFLARPELAIIDVRPR